MSKIYLPTDYVNKNCKVVFNDYIRVYDNNTYTSWTDIYFKNDYMLKSGYSQYGQSNVTCDILNTYTDNIYYRYDIESCLVIFLVLFIFCIYLPYRIFGRAFGRWFRV